jgi:formate hydrogenlyase transcriptional activator
MSPPAQKPESKHLLEAQLQATLDVIPAYAWYAAPSGGLAFVNKRSADYLGLPEDHPLRFGIAVGAAWDSHISLLHPDDREEKRRFWSTCLRTGSAGEVTFRVRNSAGEYRWFLSRSEPLRAADGTLLCWIGVNFEIDERKKAEFYLAEGERLAHTGSWAFNSAGFQYWSPQLFAIHGLDPKGNAPTTEEYLALVHPEDREFVEQEIRKIFATPRIFDFTKRIVRPDGSVRHVRCVGTPATGGGTFQGFVGTGMDVTEHEEFTKALRNSEAELQQMLDFAPQLVAVYGPNRERLHINRIALDYLSLSLEEWRQTPERGAFVHPDDRARELDSLNRALSTGSAYELELRLRKGDGSYRWFLSRSNPVRDDNGQIKRWYVAYTDIEDRKRAEDKIREQEAELRQILDLTPQLVAVFGPRRERLFINRMALDYFGLTLAEWRAAADGAVGHPDDSKRIQTQWDRAMSSGSAFEMEVRMRNGDGSYRWFLNRWNPVHDQEGRILRWHVSGTDIEDRKRAEERLQEENVALREEIDRASMFEEIVGTSPALQTVISRISKVAPTDSTVLITGETGTGKELVARAIHRRSHRASRTFVGVNCAAIPRDLIASELFGHEKGAFTGAMQRRIGRFELAGGGTIFLDEVGELSADLQVALLRVLQEREFERVGGSHPIHVDVRVIAATNRDLKAAVASGSFREDLYYRLNVFPLEVPPLRERRKDIPLLVEYFIDRYARKAGRNIRSVDKKTLQLLQSYSWPGNIRELQNVIERSVIVCEMEIFSVDESWLSQQSRDQRSGGKLYLSQKLAAKEKEVIEEALQESQGRVFGPSGAAVKLGIARSTLDSKIQALNIDKKRFKSKRGR